MKGNTLNEFISDLLETGGPEKEFVFGNKYYIIQGDTIQPSNVPGLRLDVYHNDNDEAGEYIQTYFFPGDDVECVKQFEKAKIFDGKTIYEAEKDIEVLFG